MLKTSHFKPLQRSPMKRTGFASFKGRKTQQVQGEAAKNLASQVSGKAARRASALSAGVPLRRQGKKAKLREKINRPNRAKFRELGLLDVCEARLPGCWPDGRKTWSHGAKDRKLTMDERRNLVIRACTCCHRRMDEEMSPEELRAFHENVIANRESNLVIKREVSDPALSVPYAA